MKFDVAVIGGGPGGVSAARELSRQGCRTALIEKSAPGGKAINQGYFISKVLLDLARDEKIESLDEIPGIMNLRKETARTCWNIELKEAGIAVFTGEASFKGKKNIEITSDNEQQVISAEKIILATGSRSISPLEFSADPDKGIITYQEVMSGYWLNLERIAILGGDVEGCEFACLFQQLGTEVILLEKEARLLPACDFEIAELLEEKLKVKGINIKTSCTIDSYSSLKREEEERAEGTGLSLSCRNIDEDKGFVIEADALLLTGGAEAVIPQGSEDLGLTRSGEGFIEVDSSFTTSIENIYAVGDLIGGIASANAAIQEGKAAARASLGRETNVDYQSLPYVFFTSPQVTGIGMREADIDQSSSDICIKSAEFTENLRALTLGSGDGRLKLLVSQDENIILGAHAIGENAGELSSLLTLAVKEKISLENIRELPLAHPSLSELVIKALEN